MSKVKKGETIDAWIERQPPGQGEILSKARRLVRETLPGIRETVKWSQPCYGFEARGMWVAALASHKDHVNLQLARGAELMDPEDIVEGTGKSVRHIKLCPGETFPKEALAKLLKAAGKLETS